MSAMRSLRRRRARADAGLQTPDAMSRLTWGNYHEAPLVDPTANTLDETIDASRQRFAETFGREPNPDDPLFWDEARTDRPVATTASQLTRETAQAMRAAGIRERLVFGFERTGLCPSPENERFMTLKQRRAWVRAMAEFDERGE